jgi:hypothetical protein
MRVVEENASENVKTARSLKTLAAKILTGTAPAKGSCAGKLRTKSRARGSQEGTAHTTVMALATRLTIGRVSELTGGSHGLARCAEPTKSPNPQPVEPYFRV